MYADILTEYSAKAIDQTFTYKVPERLLGKLKKGMKVLIPFGQTKINGFVINIKDECSMDNLKEIINITDYGKKFNVTCCYEHLFCFSVSFHNCRSHSSHSRGRILICHFCHLSDDFRHFYIKDE